MPDTDGYTGGPSPGEASPRLFDRLAQHGIDAGAPSTCAAEVEAIRAAWAEHPDGYAKAATPVTSAQV